MRRGTFVALVSFVAAAGCHRVEAVPPLVADGGVAASSDGGAAPADELPAPGSTRVPIAGGTLHALADGRLVIGHPHHAALSFFEDGAPTGFVSLPEGGVPGRLTSDGAGRLHVVVRNRGELVTLDPDTQEIVARRAVCAEPRGLAVEGDALHVACAGGELVTLPAAGGPPTRRVRLDDDLRDVVVADGRLYVSRFRSAELLTLDADGVVVDRRVPRSRVTLASMRREPTELTLVPNVAYRIRAMPGGGVAMLHQRSVSDPIDVAAEGYSGGGDECPNGVVHAALTVFPADGEARDSGPLAFVALAVDFAVRPDGSRFYVASAAGAASSDTSVPFAGIAGSLLAVEASASSRPCIESPPVVDGPTGAVEMAPDGTLLSLSADGDELHLLGDRGGDVRTVRVAAPIGHPRGYRLFHMQTPAFLACASCHPEGAEDGFVWNFQPAGPRRTQTLTGGIMDTAPFHWSGDQPGMHDIMRGTLLERMQTSFDADDVDAISAWVDSLPAPRGDTRDAAAIERGRGHFGSAGCADCHSGDAMTDNTNHLVGTGEPFQSPSLVAVSHRAPFFHDGRAARLADTFIAGHGEAHALDADARADLVAYLRSL